MKDFLRYSIFIFLLASVALLPAQNTKKLNQLRTQREQLQKKVKQSEQQLQSTNRNVKKTLSNLALLNGQIEKQEKAIKSIQFQIDSINSQVNSLNKQLASLSKQLAEKKQNYRRSMLYLYNNRKSQSKLLFILSADNFSQMFRRYNYVREYAKYQRVQGMQIQRKEKQVQQVQTELLAVKSERRKVLGKQEVEKGKLASQQDEQQKTIKQLQSKQKQIQSILASSKKEIAQLNGKIDYYVRLAIEQERKRREEAERKKREAAAARERERQRQEANSKGSSSSSSSRSKSSSKSSGKSKSEPMPEYKESSKEYQLGQNFASNRGRLPMPITGAYVISAHYGNYSMKGLSGVRLDNKGINLTSQGSSSARCVFDGEVSMIFSFGGLMNVLVRHGSYISVYCNLSSVSVSKGQHVSTKQVLGPIARDASGTYTLHFQLRKETSILNPESWLAK